MVKIYGIVDLSEKEIYHYVYRITNIEDNKHYYGKRSSNVPPHEDIFYRYKSSSTDIDCINDQKLNPSTYKYKIISIHDSSESALAKERKLHQKFSVSLHEQFYNKRISGGKFNNVGLVSAKSANGEFIYTDLDTFSKTNELYGVRYGYITLFKGNDKKTISLTEKDSYISNGWSGWMTGKTAYKDANNVVYIVSKAEAKLLNLVGINKGKLPVYDNQGNKFVVSIDDPRLYVSIFPIVGKKDYTSYKDNMGNCIKTHKYDPRVLSGELVGITKGNVLSLDHRLKIAKGLAKFGKKVNNSRLIYIYDNNDVLYCTLDSYNVNIDDELVKLGIPKCIYGMYKPNERFFVNLFDNSKGSKITIGKLNKSCPTWRTYIGFYYDVIKFKSIYERKQFFDKQESLKNE